MRLLRRRQAVGGVQPRPLPVARHIPAPRVHQAAHLSALALVPRQPAPLATCLAASLLETRGSLLTRRVLAAADLLMPLLKLLAVALYLPVLVGAER